MLLLTSFEPFDGTGLNSSELALREFLRLHPSEIGGVPLASTILPVAFGEDVRALRRFCESLAQSPRAILHLGQTHESVVAVEERAVNQRLPGTRDWSTKDEHIAICSGASPFLASTFPAQAILSALHLADVPARLSTDAGTYLCNHILFRSLHQAVSEGEPQCVGFLHLPRLSEQLAPGEKPASLPLQVLARAVEAACRAMTAQM